MTTAAQILTMLEGVADRSINTIQRVVLRDGDTWTVPANLVALRIQIIGPGGAGGTGGTTGGGGGGGAGMYVDYLFTHHQGSGVGDFPATGSIITATNSPSLMQFGISDGGSFGFLATGGAAGSNAATTTGGAGGNAGGVNTGVDGAGGAAGANGQQGRMIVFGGGGGGGSAGASGGNGGDTGTMFGFTFGGLQGAGSTIDGKQGNGGKGWGAGGGGGGGSSTGRGGGGGGGLWVPEYPAGGGATDGAVSTAGGLGAAGIAVLTIFRGGLNT